MRVLGEEHPDTLMSMNNMAVTLSEQGNARAAGRGRNGAGGPDARTG